MPFTYAAIVYAAIVFVAMHVFTVGLSGHAYGGFPTLCHNELIGTSLQVLCLKFVIAWLLSHSCSLYLENWRMRNISFLWCIYIRSNTLIDHENKPVSVS